MKRHCMPTKSENHCTNLAVGSVFYFVLPLKFNPWPTRNRLNSLWPRYKSDKDTNKFFGLTPSHSVISATKLILKEHPAGVWTEGLAFLFLLYLCLTGSGGKRQREGDKKEGERNKGLAPGGPHPSSFWVPQLFHFRAMKSTLLDHYLSCLAGGFQPISPNKRLFSGCVMNSGWKCSVSHTLPTDITHFFQYRFELGN